MKKKFDFIYWFIAILPFIMSACFYNRLPEQVAVHFNASGIADGFQSRLFAAFGLPAIMLTVAIIVNFCIKADPKRQNIERSKGLPLLGKWLIVILSNIMQIYIIFNAIVDIDFNMSIGMGVLTGIFIAVIGNYLPKCKQNYTIGIKVAWTLADEENWTKTHRLAGYVWSVCGVFIAIGAFYQNQYVNIVLIAVIVVVPILYSYLLYRQKKAAESK